MALFFLSISVFALRLFSVQHSFWNLFTRFSFSNCSNETVIMFNNFCCLFCCCFFGWNYGSVISFVFFVSVNVSQWTDKAIKSQIARANTHKQLLSVSEIQQNQQTIYWFLFDLGGYWIYGVGKIFVSLLFKNSLDLIYTWYRYTLKALSI